MFDNHNSNNGQRPTRCKFGLKFTPKPANPELSVQENIMNFINDYRQWEKENQQPDYSHLSTREAVKQIVEDFRTQEREEEEQKARQAQMQTPYGSGQTSYAPAQSSYGMQQNANISPQGAFTPAGQATYVATEPNGAAQQSTSFWERFRTPKSSVSKDWGKSTEQHLNAHFLHDPYYPGITNTGLVAPFKDFIRNKTQMEQDGYIGNDKYFHCKGNYQAAKRGAWGKVVGRTLSFFREVPYGIIKDGFQASADDWYANRQGWEGAAKGLDLADACSRNPRDYYK